MSCCCNCRPVLLSIALLLGTGSLCAAQAVAGPPGSVVGVFGGRQGVDPSRVSQQLALNFDVSSGYDGDRDGQTPQQLVGAPAGGFANTASLGLRYRRGRGNSFVESTARGLVNQQNVAAQALIGGEAAIQTSFIVARKLNFTGAVVGNVDSTSLVGALAPETNIGLESPNVPVLGRPQGIDNQRSLTAAAIGGLRATWTTRQATTTDFRQQNRRPLDTVGLESSTRSGMLRHDWRTSPNIAVGAVYRLEANQQDQGRAAGPLRIQSTEGSLQVDRRFSPIRTLSVSMTGGASHASRQGFGESPAAGYWMSVGSISASMGLTRVWRFSSDLARHVSLLDGVSPQPFATSTASVRLDALTSRRINLSLSGGFSRGSGLDGFGAYESSSATSQLQYGLSQCCGLFTTYSYYRHQLRDLSSLPPGLPPNYDRHAVRVGLSLWLPLYGSF